MDSKLVSSEATGNVNSSHGPQNSSTTSPPQPGASSHFRGIDPEDDNASPNSTSALEYEGLYEDIKNWIRAKIAHLELASNAMSTDVDRRSELLTLLAGMGLHSREDVKNWARAKIERLELESSAIATKIERRRLLMAPLRPASSYFRGIDDNDSGDDVDSAVARKYCGRG